MEILAIPRLYRRALLIYLGTIVAPVCGLVWLGVQSFDRQRQALDTLMKEKFATALEGRLRDGAQAAFTARDSPIAKYFFALDGGVVVEPALHAPPPDPSPPEFFEAEHQELDLSHWEEALALYRKLVTTHTHESLSLSRVARCLAKLGRTEEARSTWRKLASSYPDDRDPSHRPYGIVAAMEAGDAAGLYDRIASGRWKLPADQAEYFLSRLDAARSTPYLDQFRFARALQEQFHPPAALREGELYSDRFDGHRIYYKQEAAERIAGFAVDQEWVSRNLGAQVRRELGIVGSTGRDLRLYGGAVALVLAILSFGLILLLRDISRESSTNRVRADLVSSVSHELKTPITLIRLYGETLIRRKELGEPQRGEAYRIIVRESLRLSRLIDQVLTFSRVERGALAYNFELGDLAPAVTRIVEDYHDYLDRAGFQVERAIASSTPPVRFDENALSQAVVNLLDNAVKYSGESRHIAVRLTERAGTVTFEVEDHGIGIPPPEQGRIFDRFHRVANATGKGGYGLGLFLVRHIMQAHGGTAEVESKPGRGSRFRLVFPVVTP